MTEPARGESRGPVLLAGSADAEAPFLPGRSGVCA